MQVPPPRRPGRYRLALVCLGNICRSPIAQVVLSRRLEDAGVDDVEVTSAGTGDWHIGDPMDRRAAGILEAHGYDASRHRASRFTRARAHDHDLVLAMDSTNRDDLLALGVAPDRLALFRDFDPAAAAADSDNRDVPDPYYGGTAGFDEVLEMVERTSEELVRLLKDRL